MNFTRYVILVGLSAALFVACTDSTAESTNDPEVDRPNIMVILADDLGYSDISCFGGEIQTPNIDQLADNGLKYTQFYNAARCCPSRASLLTGLYPHQAGLGHMMNDLGYESYKGDLSHASVTLAEVLKPAGYETYMAGKWHLTRFTKKDDPKGNWPMQRGFDHFYGTLLGYGSQFDPPGLMEGNEFIEPQGEFYYTEALSNKSVEFIEEASKDDVPFFMYVSYTAPHYPLHARDSAIEKYRGKFSEGWDILRQERLERMEAMGIMEEENRLSDKDGMSNAWEDEENKEWQASRMEAYAGMVHHVDQGIGKIIRALKERGQLDNTLIFFLSDNGGSAEGHLYGTIERWGIPWKSALIPEITRNGEKVVSGDIPGLELGPETTFGSYGPKWSNLSNAPFRMHKNWVHEGGIATPLIVHWPEGISGKGELRRQTGHVMDIMATCVDIAAAKYPAMYNENPIKHMEGTSLIPTFTDDEIHREGPLFWEHEGNRAMLKDEWKLVSAYPGSWSSMMAFPYDGNWELYNLKQDRTETNNLASQFPEKVKELSAEWNAWADRVGVVDFEDLGLETYK